MTIVAAAGVALTAVAGGVPTVVDETTALTLLLEPSAEATPKKISSYHGGPNKARCEKRRSEWQ